LSLPMGWVESPLYFCTATETVADVINQCASSAYAPPHQLQSIASTPTKSLSACLPVPLTLSGSLELFPILSTESPLARVLPMRLLPINSLLTLWSMLLLLHFHLH
jgi:hypothetical protein